VLRLWQDIHKSTQGWKVSFWESVRGKSVWILTILLRIFCKISFTPAVTSCYQVYALNADAHLFAALLCYFRCNWWRNLAAVCYILHWIALTLSMLQMGITLVIAVAYHCYWLHTHHNHKMSIRFHKNGLVSSHQSVGRWLNFVFCSKDILTKLVGYQQPTCLCVKMGFVVGTISLLCELFSHGCFRSRVWPVFVRTQLCTECFISHVQCCGSCMVSAEYST